MGFMEGRNVEGVGQKFSDVSQTRDRLCLVIGPPMCNAFFLYSRATRCTSVSLSTSTNSSPPFFLTACTKSLSRIDCELEGLAIGSGRQIQIDASSVSDL